ncbi:cytochrome c oxidase assembly protein [Robbsia sp. Bb-Pol-6]|uniref:Cytochrome c oxidase assembly protein n=1 Tax=Robbsia betulipollinis TaxID=2981849 RepID=A0ABT3ZPP6_9BURK|nr:cytochrome c oxidase assembly protein [Robbsia betulipollinis]MCY0388529.1 cytochrome c oxidase assembly protein [Robbsia betulipollinis]
MTLLHWLSPWEPSPTFVAVFLSFSVLYLRGTRRQHVSLDRQLAFWLGMAGIYIALHTRLDYYFERQFFLHRLQHLVLHHLGPFLIALGHPGAVLRAGMPVRVRQRVFNPFLRWPPVRYLLNVLLHPVVAVVLFTGIIYFWLASSVHFIAMLDWRLYRVMNWSVTVDGLLFWCLVLDRRPAPPARLSPGKRILVIVAAAPPQIVLGAYVFFSTHDRYPIYALCGRALVGMSALRDQQLGGLILWIPGAMMSAVGALIALRHWLRLSARGRLRAGTRGAQLRRMSRWGMPSSR